LTNDGLTEGMTPGQTHQQRAHGDTYPHTHDTPTTSDSSVITADIQVFNESSLVVDNHRPLPPRQESLSSTASWYNTTPAVNPIFHDGIPLPLQTANNTVQDTSCLAKSTE